MFGNRGKLHVCRGYWLMTRILRALKIFIFSWGFLGVHRLGFIGWCFCFTQNAACYTVMITSMFFTTKYNYLRMWWQLKYLLFLPPTWGWWTQFDEHIFQMGWFNHQLAKNVAGGCLFLEQNKPFSYIFQIRDIHSILLGNLWTTYQLFKTCLRCLDV